MTLTCHTNTAPSKIENHLSYYFTQCYILFFSLLRRLRRAGSVYVYHYTFGFNLDFLLKQYNSLNSGCPFGRVPVMLSLRIKFQSFYSKARNDCPTSRRLLTASHFGYYLVFMYCHCLVISYRSSSPFHQEKPSLNL